MMPNNPISRMGLASYIALVSAGLMILLTLIIVAVLNMASTDKIKSEIGQRLEELAFQTTDKLDRGMFERYREVQLMAARAELANNAVSAGQKRDLLESMQRTYPYYAWIGLTDNQGKVLVAAGKLLEGADVSKRPWFGNAYRNIHLHDVHDAVLLAKLLPNPTGEPKRFFDVAFPYLDTNGKPAGILGVHLSWQWAQEIEKSVFRPQADRSKVETLIISKDATVLLGPAALIGVKLKQVSFDNAQGNKSGYVTELWPDGKNYLVGYSNSEGYRNYPGFGWTVLVRQELSEAHYPVVALQNSILWSGLTAAIVCALIAFMAARKITRPLAKIAKSASQIESGHDGAIHIDAGGYHEITTLAGSLNALLSKLNVKEQSLLELNATLEHRVADRTAELAQAVVELKSSEHRVRAIIDTALDAFVGVDTGGNITDWNPQAEAVFGRTRAEALGQPIALAIPQLFQEGVTKGLDRQLTSGNTEATGKRLELSALRRDGEMFPIEMTIGVIETAGTYFFGAFVQDISARRHAEQAIAESQQRLATIADNMPAAILYIDQSRQYRFSNRIFESWLGIPAYSIYGKTIQAVFLEQGYAESIYAGLSHHIDAVLAGKKEVFELQRLIHGESRFLEATYVPHFGSDGAIAGFYAMMQDITERKRQELYYAHHASHDALTGLPNRQALMNQLTQATARSRRSLKALAVMFLDLNKFKQINDTHGHAVGDQILVGFAARLRDCVRKTDTVARLSGDEFVIIAEDLNQGESDAMIIAEKINTAMQVPLLSGDTTIIASTSIGITLSLHGNESPDDLLAWADKAMYRAKQEGTKPCFYP